MPASTPSVSRSLCPTTRKYTASVDPPRQRVIGFRAVSKRIGRARRLVLNAAAKVNLILEVLGKRDDGYHELVTVMQAVDLSDRITLEDADVLELASSPGVPADGRNLALRAATALREAAGVTRGARITLDKRIPVAAGLGGGSADAAAVLLGLNRLWRLRWPGARRTARAATRPLARAGAGEPALRGEHRGDVRAGHAGDVHGRPPREDVRRRARRTKPGPRAREPLPWAAGGGGGRVPADRADAGGATGGGRAGRADVGERADGVRRRAVVRPRAA